jgi:hypothetical protein
MFIGQLLASMVGMKVVVINKFEEHLFLRAIENHKVLYPFNILHIAFEALTAVTKKGSVFWDIIPCSHY